MAAADENSELEKQNELPDGKIFFLCPRLLFLKSRFAFFFR